MKQTVFYDEGYEYDIHLSESSMIHFDYGTRYNRINMQFSHFHSEYEIYFLLNGQAQHFIEGKSYELNTHDFVLLNPYRLHRTNYFEHQPCKRLILQFTLDPIKSFFPEALTAIDELFSAEEPIYRFSQSQNAQLIHFFNQIYKVSKQSSKTTDLLVATYFLQLLEHLYQNKHSNEYFQNNEHKGNIPTNPMELKIYEVTSHIHKYYGNPLTLKELSSVFFISPHYLSRQFKKITGFTLVQYIQETRIKRAQELLLDTNMKIVDIVDICGFGSISQFNRVFNNLVGHSPSSYRKRNKL